MALVVEDGTGLAGATSFVSRAWADAYFADRMYADTWTAATTISKDKALVTASRMLDAYVLWMGDRATTTQALGWPRKQVVIDGVEIANNVVPTVVQQATAELGLALLSEDRTNIGESGGAGIEEIEIHDGVRIRYSEPVRKQALPASVVSLVSIVGSTAGLMAKVVRG